MQDNQDNKEQNAAEKPAEAANEPKMDMKSDTPAPDPKPPAGTKDPGESQKMNDAGGMDHLLLKQRKIKDP